MKNTHIQLPHFVSIFIDKWLNPYKRYRYSRVIHALRVGTAVLIATLIGRGFNLPHGEWIGITVFVILGMLPYKGDIYSKAIERLFGTIIGLLAALFLLWLNQHYLHDNWIFYSFIALFSAIAGWRALGKSGYIAMLAGLTMCMLLGEASSDWLNGSIMRALNVMIGAAIALGISRIAPLKSTLMWRFTLSDNLFACSKQLADMNLIEELSPEQYHALIEKQKNITTRLLKCRALLNATAQESKINLGVLEGIQQSQRTIVSSVDLLLHNIRQLSKPELTKDENNLLSHHFFSLEHDLRLIAYFLKGTYAKDFQPDASDEIDIRYLASKLSFEWQGFISLSLNIRTELFSMLSLLNHSRVLWQEQNERKRHIMRNSDN